MTLLNCELVYCLLASNIAFASDCVLVESSICFPFIYKRFQVESLMHKAYELGIGLPLDSPLV